MAKILVVGAYASRGVIPAEGDKPAFEYDSTKLVTQVNFKRTQLANDEKTGLPGALGNTVELFSFGDSITGMRHMHNLGVTLPCVLEVELQAVKGGNEVVSVSKVGK